MAPDGLNGNLAMDEWDEKQTEQRIRALAVDDEVSNLVLIRALARNMEMEIACFSNPAEALDYCYKEDLDIIFIDHFMPFMTGIEFIEQIPPNKKEIPIVMITASDNEKLKLEALEKGATDFLRKPLNLTEFKARVTNLILLRRSQLALKRKARSLENDVRRATLDIRERELESLLILGRAAEYRDTDTGIHINRVARFSEMIARRLGLSKEERTILFHAAPLHDIGKIGIPDAILLKKGKLTQHEYEIMKRHARIGFDILRQSSSPYLRAGSVIALSHHEKWDGSGYPDGLSGEAIPLFGRIVAVADVFDALTMERPYKEAWEFNDAMEYLARRSGNYFDPELVRIFVSEREQIREIQKNPFAMDVSETDF